MTREEDEVSVRLMVMMCSLGVGALSLIVFFIYWFCFRVHKINGVVLALPNPVPSNTVMVPVRIEEQNYASHPGPQYPVLSPYPSGMAVPQPAVTSREAPPPYNQAFHQADEGAAMLKTTT